MSKQVPDSAREFAMLEHFKKYMQSEFKALVKTRYGLDFYSQHVSGRLEEFLVSLEEDIETVAEQAVHDEDLVYNESFEGE